MSFTHEWLRDYQRRTGCGILNDNASRLPTSEPKPTRVQTLGVEGRLVPLLVDPGGALIVRITRYGRNTWDDDNLAAGFKSCRDAIAAAFGRASDSREAGFFWEYDQKKSANNSVVIEVWHVPHHSA